MFSRRLNPRRNAGGGYGISFFNVGMDGGNLR
jgi:hypothetical protein